MIEPNEHGSPIEVLTLSGPPLPVDLEFNPVPPTEAFKAHGLTMGRCFGSKSAYARNNPRREFIPNANVFTKQHGKVWWGDLDLMRDKPALEKVAHRLRCRLYVLRELGGRFDEATQPHKEVVEAALWHSGGPSRVPGVRQFFRRSGLSHAEAAILLKISQRLFNKPQQPKTALEISRRMRKFEEVFIPIAANAGHRKWGFWWTRPSKKLAGKSPLQVLKSGETLDFGKISKPTIGLVLFSIMYGVMERL